MSSQMTDVATRVWNHTFKLDPICRSILDTDIYKLLMLQTIWKENRDTPVTFSLINRTQSVRIADEIDQGELIEQLDHARSLQLTHKEYVWLAGNTFYGKERLFTEDFIRWLRNYRLPGYELHKEDGQYRIDFSGTWADVSLWEIPVLTIIGLQFSFLLAGGIVIEQVFYMPGLGRLIFQAISARDLIVVESVVMLLVFVVIVVNFAVDIAYAAVDPRLRAKA